MIIMMNLSPKAEITSTRNIVERYARDTFEEKKDDLKFKKKRT